MTPSDIFVRYVHGFAYSVKGIITPNDDGTISIYINADLSDEQKKAALQHELRHIQEEHLYNIDAVSINELHASGKVVNPPVEEHPTSRPKVVVLKKPAKPKPALSLAKVDEINRRRLLELEEKWLYDVK